MVIQVRFIKYLFMLGPAIVLLTSLEDKNWGNAAVGLAFIPVVGLLGYGLERLILYMSHSPGGTRWSRFWIGR